MTAVYGVSTLASSILVGVNEVFYFLMVDQGHAVGRQLRADLYGKVETVSCKTFCKAVREDAVEWRIPRQRLFHPPDWAKGWKINRLTTPADLWNKHARKMLDHFDLGAIIMQDRSIKIVVLFLFPLLLYLVPLPFMPLMEPDEGRYSAIPSAMNATGDYVTPRLKAAVYFEKPPLVYWATAFFFRIFGENEFSSRLFAALCAWGCILLVYRMGLFFHDTRTGLYAAAVLTTV